MISSTCVDNVSSENGFTRKRSLSMNSVMSCASGRASELMSTNRPVSSGGFECFAPEPEAAALSPLQIGDHHVEYRALQPLQPLDRIDSDGDVIASPRQGATNGLPERGV